MSVYEYMMLEPRSEDELPANPVEYEPYKDEQGFFRWWGRVVYDRPLTGTEIDRCNLDGPMGVFG